MFFNTTFFLCIEGQSKMPHIRKYSNKAVMDPYAINFWLSNRSEYLGYRSSTRIFTLVKILRKSKNSCLY